MTRWLPVVAVGGAVALVAVVAVVALAPRAPATDAQRAEGLAAELRCPDCQGLSVADSPTASAQEIRRQIDDLIAEGATDDEIRAHFVARYGEWIRLAPSAAIAWIVPFAVLVGGTALLVAWLRKPNAATATPTRLTDDERRRLRDEVEALDA